MSTVKATKVGNSITITLPKELGVKIGEEFTVKKDEIALLCLFLK